METKIQKWGNSLALRLPKSFVKEAQIAYGSSVDLYMDEGKIVIAPLPKPTYRLEDMLEEVTEDNLHSEVDTGPAVGKEKW